MKKLLLLNPDRCCGCGICESVCSISHEGVSNPEKSRIRIIRSVLNDADVPVVCFKCEKPVCKDVCQFDAIQEDLETGAMKFSEEKCIGCRMCIYACPVSAPTINPDRHVAVNCDLCDGNPNCVKFCPTEALEYVREDIAGLAQKREGIEKLSEILRAMKRELASKAVI